MKTPSCSPIQPGWRTSAITAFCMVFVVACGGSSNENRSAPGTSCVGISTPRPIPEPTPDEPAPTPAPILACLECIENCSGPLHYLKDFEDGCNEEFSTKTCAENGYSTQVCVIESLPQLLCATSLTECESDENCTEGEACKEFPPELPDMACFGDEKDPESIAFCNSLTGCV